MTDVLLIILGALIIAWHTWRGFFKSLLSVIRLIASVVLSWLLAPLIFGDSALLRYIGCLVVFIVIYILLTVILRLMNKIIKNITGLKTANRVLGFLLGCFCAYVFMSFAVIFITVLAEFTDVGFFGMTYSEIYDNTIIFRFFENYGAFAIINQ